MLGPTVQSQNVHAKCPLALILIGWSLFSPCPQILECQGFAIESRGVIQVKGKGQMETYFVNEYTGTCMRHRLCPAAVADGEDPAAVSRQGSTRRNLASVVYGMVQNRRRMTLRSGQVMPASV